MASGHWVTKIDAAGNPVRVWVADSTSSSSGTPTSSSSSSSSSGSRRSSSGGSPAGSKAQAYERYMRNIGMKVISPAVQWAVKNDADSAMFDMYLRQNYTKQYLASGRGAQIRALYKERWQLYFPGAKPKVSDLLAYVKGTKGVPWNAQQVDYHIQSTPLFKQQYVAKGLNVAAPALRTNPIEFRNYADTFKSIMQQYGVPVTNQQYRLFFGGHLDPSTFAQNAETVFGGAEAYKRWTGQPLSQNQTNAALYGYTGSANAQAKIAQAYQQLKEFQASKPAQFDVGLNDQGRITQTGTF